MQQTVITTGDKYFEIDSLASILAYADLLKLQGKETVSVIRGPKIHNITDIILSWNLDYVADYTSKPNDLFVIMDISDPNSISLIVNKSRIIALYDHHFGFEKYWQEKIGVNAHIEKVGACATLVWEEYEKAKLADKISPLNANLLYTAIISNTLNFQASVTSKRDRESFKRLKKHINLPSNWIETYFRDQEKVVFANPEAAIKGDTKIISYPNLPFELVIGQLELWDSRNFIKGHLPAVERGLASFGNPHWFLTSPSISEGKNYFYTTNQEVKNLLEKVLEIKFIDNLGQTDKLILRKEILKKLLDYHP